MKVRATKLGYYDHKRVREGQVFELKTINGHRKDAAGKLTSIVIKPEQQFSDLWMERVDSVKAETPAKSRNKKNEVEQDATADDDVI